jgi:predicted DsbA family dithiol-disulfide isomerase
VAERFRREYGVELTWEPFFLRPDAPPNGWALPEYIRARMNRPDNPLQQRAKALGLPLVEREWIPSSRHALEANEFVRPTGRLDAFHSAVNDRYWAKAQDISDWAVLEAAANDVGVDGKAMRAQAEAGAFNAALERRIAQARALGINAVPTYVFLEDGEPAFGIQGAQDWSVFQRAADRLGLKPASVT